MEAAREAVGLISLSDQSQLPGVFSVFRAHVLDVNLKMRGRRVSRMWIYETKTFELKNAKTRINEKKQKLAEMHRRIQTN